MLVRIAFSESTPKFMYLKYASIPRFAQIDSVNSNLRLRISPANSGEPAGCAAIRAPARPMTPPKMKSSTVEISIKTVKSTRHQP
jgi:hypothetical protein